MARRLSSDLGIQHLEKAAVEDSGRQGDKIYKLALLCMVIVNLMLVHTVLIFIDCLLYLLVCASLLEVFCLFLY